MIKKLILLFVVLFSIQEGIAQDKKIWTLKECIDYALQNSLNVKRSLLLVEGSQVNLDQSKFQMLPTLNGGSSFGYNWGRNIDPTTNEFITQRINSVNLNASSSFLIFNGLRLMNTYRQNDLDNEATQQDFTKAKNDVILSVVTFYTSVIFNRELFLNAQSQLTTTTQQLERTRRLAEAGSVPRGNVLDLEAQQATNELNQINRENALNLSVLQLKQALQLPASTQMEIEVPQLDIGSELVMTETSEQIYESALATLPEVKSAQLKLRSSLLGLKASRGSLYPRLSVNANLFSNYSSAADRERFIGDGGQPTIFLDESQPVGAVGGAGGAPVYGYSFRSSGTRVSGYSVNDQISDNLARSASLSLQIPIFNGYQARSGVQRSLISNQQASITLQDTENRLRQSVETAFNDAVASAKTYQSALKQVSAREEAFRMLKQRFDNGAVNFVEYQVAENALFQAKSDLVRAKYDFIFKKKVLDFYQGKPLEF
jgi:outer membrane protein